MKLPHVYQSINPGKKLKQLLYSKEYNFEQHLFDLTCSIMLVYLVLGILLNFLMGLPAILNIMMFLTFMITLIAKWYNRERKKLNKSMARAFFLNLILILNACAFFNAGSFGPVYFLTTIFCVIPSFIFFNKKFLLIPACQFVIIIFLLFLESKDPSLFLQYDSEESRFIDISVSTFYGLGLLCIVMYLFMDAYNKEKEKVEKSKKYISTLLSEITGQKEELNRTVTELSRKNDFIQLLLKETNHRVKNNFQLLSSTLSLQLSKVEEEETKNIIKDNISRISTLSVFHNSLLYEKNISEVDLGSYFNNLIENIKILYYEDTNFTIKTNLENVTTGLNTAVTLGFILNELISNSLKHAGNNSNKEINIEVLSRKKGKGLNLVVKDNGAGTGKEKSGADSFGKFLIDSVVEKYKGKIEYHHENGMKIEINLPIL